MRSLLRFVLCLLVVSPFIGAQTSGSVLDKKGGLDRWLNFIRPSKKELAYEQFGWRNRFWPAVEEARRLGRPILLWTMNGHPLGCT